MKKSPVLLIFGLHAVMALLKKNAKQITQLFVQHDRHDKKMLAIFELAEKNSIDIEYVSREQLNRLTQEGNHQGVAAQYHKTKNYTEQDLKMIISNASTAPFLLILDHIKDPHNLGACFRSADAAGVHAIIAPKDQSVGITPSVSKVASGAVETVPFVQVTNLARTLKELKSLGIWIYGAATPATQSLYYTNLSGPIAIVLGAEESGLRRLTRESCDMLVNIPMYGSVSSLNISVAAGIFLFEAVRQRQSVSLY